MPPTDLGDRGPAPERAGRAPSKATGPPEFAGIEGQALLRALASPDEVQAERALRQWKHLLERKLICSVTRMIPSRWDAEEVVADAFVKLWRHHR